jgi:hypothetical protein
MARNSVTMLMFASAPRIAGRDPSLASLSIHDLLQGKVGFRPIQPKNRELMVFVSKHITTILDYVFSSESAESSKTAFLLLTNQNDHIVNALIDNHRLLVKATEVLSRRDVPDWFVSRLASLFMGVIRLQGGEVIGILFQLLPFVSNIVVLDLFKLSCSESSLLQSALARSNFASLVLGEFDEDESKSANLCSLIGTCLRNPVLGHAFDNERTQLKLAGLLRSRDVRLLSEVWACLCCLCSEKFASKMTTLIGEALKTLRETGARHAHSVAAVDFLRGCLRSCLPSFAPGQAREALNVVVGLLAVAPESTHLMNAAFRLIRAAMRSAETLDVVFELVLPVVLLLFADTPVRNAARASALSLLADMEESRRKCKAVDGVLAKDALFTKIVAQQLLPFLRTSRDAYGGRVSRPVHKSASAEDVGRRLVEVGDA